jgi:PAS domain-containing protein
LRDALANGRRGSSQYREELLRVVDRSERELVDLDLEVPMHRPDGKLRWLHLPSRPHRAGGRIVWDGVVTDITRPDGARQRAAVVLGRRRNRDDIERRRDHALPRPTPAEYLTVQRVCSSKSMQKVDP